MLGCDDGCVESVGTVLWLGCVDKVGLEVVVDEVLPLSDTNPESVPSESDYNGIVVCFM